MAEKTKSCIALQKSLEWCQGMAIRPGIRRRLYYISKSAIATYPKLPVDEKGRPTSAVYTGSFTLVADQKWKHIDILPDKSTLTSEAQGEVPSQTQLNKLTAVHPDTGEEATAAALYINNSDNIFIVQDMMGKYRVIGNDMYDTKNSVAQDVGEGATGTASTTISAEVTDVVPAPYYTGTLDTEEGEISCADSE